MRINYNRLLDLNKEAMGIDREMACYWVIQGGVERIVNGEPLVSELCRPSAGTVRRPHATPGLAR